MVLLFLMLMFCSTSYAQEESDTTIVDRVAALETIVAQLSSGQENIQEMLQQTISRLNQLEEFVQVLNALSQYNNINNNLDKLLQTEVAVDAQLNLANAQMEENWEEIKDGFISFIDSIQIDPAGIITSSASTAITVSLDIGDVVDLSSAVAELNTAKANITLAIAEYNTEVTARETYYNTLKNAYENKHGIFDQNAPPSVPPISFCVRGQACQQKPGNFRDPELHQTSCPDKIDGWFFGLGDQDCPGHVYSCDPNFLCPRWNDHLIDGYCGHRYPNSEKDNHKILMPGPCGDDHYACDKAHEYVKHCRVTAYARIWTSWGYNYVNVNCINQTSYYKCTPHKYRYPVTNSNGYSYYYY